MDKSIGKERAQVNHCIPAEMVTANPAIHIKKPILYPMFGGFIFILVVNLVSVLWITKEQENAVFEMERSSLATQFHDIVDSSVMELTSQAETISHIESLQRAFAQKDRDLLLKESLPLNKVIADNAITHFYFHDLDRVNFLRVHHPDRHGDRTDRLTLLTAEESGQVAHGIELGPLGTLTLRVVLPWKSAGNLLGYIELGREINHLVDSLGTRANLTVHVVVSKEHIGKSGFAEGVAGIFSHWAQFSDVVLMGNSEKTLTDGLQEYINDGTFKRPENARHGDSFYKADPFHFFSIPILNLEKVAVGYLVVAIDFRSFLSHSAFHVLLVSCSGVVILMLLFLLYSKHINSLERSANAVVMRLRAKALIIVSSTDHDYRTPERGAVRVEKE